MTEPRAADLTCGSAFCFCPMDTDQLVFRKEELIMLVLTRHPGEEIIINDSIRLTVVAVRGERVRIGVSAPPTVLVNRKEVQLRRDQRLRSKRSQLKPTH